MTLGISLRVCRNDSDFLCETYPVFKRVTDFPRFFILAVHLCQYLRLLDVDIYSFYQNKRTRIIKKCQGLIAGENIRK